MPLDKSTLQAAFKTAFDTAKEENWSTEQVAEALADAVDVFVRSGDVVGITTDVEVDPDTGLGTGTQSGAGHIE